ncbi:ATP-binding protein [Streptomyces lichenis]|uniref:ATP-binding protein n=1 Tax=Streptomyces lichenis TaxID=2306967 RepID=A0ABT0I5M4_9ACTN|nr:ATP-binding protein [Streptomyces lichenis]MCK8676621.1 ATP-binding protein [Streptomyces lichenis]
MNAPVLAPLPRRERAAACDQLTLVAAKSAVSCARAFTRLALAKWCAEGVQDDALLVVSELVTNAVNATGVPAGAEAGPNVVTVRLLGADGRLTVEVWDVSRERPVLTDAAEGDEGGRGLALVGALAARWGSDAGPGGKVVWAELHTAATPMRTPGRVPWQQPWAPCDGDLLRRVLAGLQK